ncbi:MAG TPA: thermonuclease family protein [Acetobacteraceae bacterium]|nr:thermonuclease family protein [Acetobacteraceae bacterium]
MPIDRPRRIFRSAFPRLDARGLAMLLGVGLIAATGVSLAMLPHRDAATPLPPAEELSAQPMQVAVVDGGTLLLRDRVVLLQGVAPPPRGTACEPHDGSDEDCGAAAANALAALVREAPVACRITGADGLGRPFAICQASGTELNRAVIAAGWARADGRQPALKQAEDTARAERRGVWASVRNPGW